MENSYTIKGLNFKAVRKHQNKTLRQVEEDTGISNAYLSQLETGRVNRPSFEIVEKLLNYYGFKISIIKYA